MKHNMRDSKGRFCKKAAEPVEPVTRGYKGFKKGLICRDKQYEVGKTYEEHGKKICEEGMMHFCENPLDVLNFYPVFDPATGEPNEFAEVEAIGRVVKDGKKVATNKLRVVRRLSLEELIKVATIAGESSHATTTGDCADVATSRPCSHAATTGWCSYAATVGSASHAVTVGNNSRVATTGDDSYAVAAGYRSHAMTAGWDANATTTGECSHATTTGNCSNATTVGYKSHAMTAGFDSNAATVGYKSHAITAGAFSSATAGEFSIAAALGIESKAKAALGSWIVLAEYDRENKPLLVKAAKVDGNIIKADTFYRLAHGKFVEC